MNRILEISFVDIGQKGGFESLHSIINEQIKLESEAGREYVPKNLKKYFSQKHQPRENLMMQYKKSYYGNKLS